MLMIRSEEGQERPTKFTPEWPPKSFRPQSSHHTKCSEEFKKVAWPPKDDDGPQANNDPVTSIHLQDEMSLNDERWKPCGTYHLVPTIYAEQPAQLEDAWPPPEPLDLSERVIHDASRPKRAIRDYTVHFAKNKKPEDGKPHKVPPGTLHVIADRGVLCFDNVDIGRATMADMDATEAPGYRRKGSDSSL